MTWSFSWTFILVILRFIVVIKHLFVEKKHLFFLLFYVRPIALYLFFFSSKCIFFLLNPPVWFFYNPGRFMSKLALFSGSIFLSCWLSWWFFLLSCLLNPVVWFSITGKDSGANNCYSLVPFFFLLIAMMLFVFFLHCIWTSYIFLMMRD